jgi:hypothetical protein
VAAVADLSANLIGDVTELNKAVTLLVNQEEGAMAIFDGATEYDFNSTTNAQHYNGFTVDGTAFPANGN